jgi:lipopolysaccharide/colanic/teichoic acid biosynthesis glycosyltransferase
MKSNKQDYFATDASITVPIGTSTKDIRISNGKSLAFWVKRSLDSIVSCVTLILLLPFFVLIAIAIKLDSPGPIFHKHYRIGLKGRQFRMWKFRTMIATASDLQVALDTKNQAKGGVLFKLKVDPRCTTIGRFLRRYSIDELPQIINVIKGEMSLVGPRPLILRDAAQLPTEMLFRHDVLPGITGLWQIKGRSSLDVEQLYHWDSIYIQTWSLLLDISILLQTIGVVIYGHGSY